jgi:RNA-directed DNA polymerase
VASPLLANVYLHYVYDLWVQQWRKRHATGDMIVVRYADDTIVGFQHRREAERFLDDLKDRLAQFALSLHPEKTRLIEFGAYAAERRQRRGESKPETFDFLGFTHYCGTRKDGAGFQLGRRTQRKRMRVKLKEITETLRRVRHRPIDEQGQWLGTVIGGYFAYFAVPTNTHMLSSTGRTNGACPGYVRDHVRPFSCGGPDAVENMQCQTVADAKAKDRLERSVFRSHQKARCAALGSMTL